MKQYQVVWSPKALHSLNQIYEYILAESLPGAKKVVTELIKLGNSLENMPYRFALEPLLADQPVEFRYATKRSYKLIYTIEEKEDQIFIVQVFNTRQHPSKLEV